MRKKLVAMTLALMLGATAVTGCTTTTTEEAGEAPAAEGTESGEAAEGEESGGTSNVFEGSGDAEMTVFLYMQEHEKKIYADLIQDFVKEHDSEIKSVTFEVTTQEEYGTKMTANMTAQDMPDVFYCGPESIKTYADNGYIRPLDDVIDQSAIDQLWTTLAKVYRYDGTTAGTGEGSLYALPKDLSCFAFAYNKDLFDEAGLDYPDPNKPYTYDEFLKVCQALTKDKDGDGETDQWGVACANAWGMDPFFYSNGARMLSEDYKTVNVANNPKLKEALQFYTDLTTKYGVTPSVEQDTALGGYQRWLDGQIGFYACGTWDVAAFLDDATFPYEWDLCGWPVGPSATKSSTWLGTVGYAVSATTKYPELAAALITKLSTDQDGQEKVSGYAEGYDSIQLPNIMDFAKGEYKDAVASGKVAYASNIDVIYGYIEGNDNYEGILRESTYTPNAEWWDLFQQGVTNIQTGDISVEDFLKEIEPQMQQSLDDAYAAQ